MTELRYATHLGYRSIETPLFLPTLGTLDPAVHIELAARLGFRGVQVPQAMNMSPQSVSRTIAALAATGLEGSCIVCAPRAVHASPLWSRTGPDIRQRIQDIVSQACSLAVRLRSRTLAVVPRALIDEDLVGQREALVENLRLVAPMVAAHGLVLCIEPMRVFEDTLVRSSAEAADIVSMVDHAAVRMIFDTGHSWAMDGDVVSALAECYEFVSLVQIADQPGRIEPGSGEIDMVGVLALLMRQGFDGLVGLENDWSTPGAAGMEAGIETFWRVHELASRAAANHAGSGLNHCA